MSHKDKRPVTFHEMRKQIVATAEDACNIVSSAFEAIRLGLILESEIATQFSSSPDEVASQAKIVEAIGNNKALGNMFTYFSFGVRVKVNLRTVRVCLANFEEQHKRLPIPSPYEKPEEFVAALSGIVDNLEIENPLFTPSPDVPDIADIASMKNQLDKDGSLSKENIQALDRIYAEPSETLDVAYASFLYTHGVIIGAGNFAPFRMIGYSAKDIKMLDDVAHVIHSYFIYYSGRCTDGMFAPELLQDEPIIPQEASLLPAFIAMYIRGNLQMLPPSFGSLLDNGLIPGLTDQAREAIKKGYADAHAKNYDTILSYQDAYGDSAYLLVKETADAGKTSETFLGLKNTYESLELPETPPNTITQIKLRYPDIQKYLAKKVEYSDRIRTIGTWGNFRVDVASYSPLTIDIMFVNDNNEACALHIDAGGRLIGMPQEQNGLLIPVAEAALAQLISYIDAEQESAQLAQDLLRKSKRMSTFPIVPPTPQSVMPEQIEHLVAPKQLKRKTERRLGLGSDETPIAQVNNSEIETIPIRQILFTSNFMHDRASLSPDMQSLLNNTLAAVAEGRKKRKRLQSVKGEFKGYKGKIFATRFSSYRMIFVETEDGIFHALSVKHGHDGYDELLQKVGSIKQLLARK